MNLRIVAKNLTIGDDFRDRIERRLYFALGRFSPAVKSVDLTFRDENGPRGGVDKRCRIVVRVRGAEDIVVEGRGDNASALVNRTADRAGRAVARAIGLRQRKGSVRASGDAARRR